MGQIRNHIIEKNNVENEDLKISILGIPSIKELPKNIEKLSVKIHPKAKLLGITRLPVEYFDDKGELRFKNDIAAEVDILGSVLRTVGNLTRGDVLTSKNTSVKKESLRAIPYQRLSSQDQIIDRETVSQLAEGSLLTPWNTRKIPQIKAGDIINLILKSGNIKLKVRAKAISDGYKGKKIKVKTLLKESRIIKGDVVNHETVEHYY